VVFQWKLTDNEPRDAKNWLAKVINCPQPSKRSKLANHILLIKASYLPHNRLQIHVILYSHSIYSSNLADRFIPCANRIVFAIDSSKSNQYYQNLKYFLIEYVFAGNWNHLERLAMLWYGSRIEDFFMFDYFGDNTSKNLDFVRRAVNSKPQIKHTTPDLYILFKQLHDFYKGNKYFQDVRK
jgi:hypothetical protein